MIDFVLEYYTNMGQKLLELQNFLCDMKSDTHTDAFQHRLYTYKADSWKKNPMKNTITKF